MRARHLAMGLALAIALAARPALATFVIVNTDGPDEGFNDPTPAAPVGGNPGTTVGQQRLNTFAKAGEIWDVILNSPVPIRVQASFNPLSCAVTSGVLGSAGPFVVDADFVGAPHAGTWYTGAQADRLTGVDLDPSYPDIFAQFNSELGTASCLTSRYWYYGYDHEEGANGIDLLAVLLHEFAHGLGFLTLTDETDGDYFSGLPTIFDRYLFDASIGKHWIDMSPAERVASAINTTHLVWDGPSVTGAAPLALGPRAHVVTSGALTADYPSGQGVFYTPPPAGGVTGDVVLVEDGAGTVSDGCDTPFDNAGVVAGRIALMDRSSSCTMALQAAHAESAGAVGVIILNNVAGPAPPLRGAAPAVGIPVASLSLTDGDALRAALGSGSVQARLDLDPAGIAGADASGRVIMYTPDPLQPGSSVSHWDVSAFPNLLMEPSINPDLQGVDLTLQAFRDIGWLPQTADVRRVPSAGLAFSHAPNPARDGGMLRFRLADQRRVEVTLFDVTGRRIARLANEVMSAGDHELRWTRRDDRGYRVGAGVYKVRLRSGDVERTVTIVLLD